MALTCSKYHFHANPFFPFPILLRYGRREGRCVFLQNGQNVAVLTHLSQESWKHVAIPRREVRGDNICFQIVRALVYPDEKHSKSCGRDRCVRRLLKPLSD